MRHHLINGVKVPFTSAEEVAQDAVEADWEADAENRRLNALRNITFDDFESRFTSAEWDDATDYVYEVNITSGKPKRRTLVQGLARAQARNNVDLLDSKTDAFLSLLVTGNVITEARKTDILTP